MRSSMWSTMPDPVALPGARGALQQLDQLEPLSVERDRPPCLEADRDRLRLVRRLLGPGDELEDLVGGGGLEVLDLQPFRGAAPEVVVDRVGSRLGAALDRYPVLAGVGDLLLAAHPPLAHRGDHLQLGVQRGDGRLQPHLVVALAGAAVGDRVATGPPRRLDPQPRDQRPAQRGEQRVAAPVEAVGEDRRQDVVLGELLAGIHHHRCPRHRGRGPCPSPRRSPRRAGRG